MTFNASENNNWSRIPFKWICLIPSGQVDPKGDSWADLPLIAPNHIESGTGRLLLVETARDQAAESGKYAFPAGTVLYSNIRPALAKACIAPESGLCSADMYPIIPSARLRPAYLLMQLLSKTFTDWAVLESMRVAMPKINREALGAFRLLVPPIKAQHAMIQIWSADAARAAAMMAAVTASIDRLRELRCALITAAVTGQIDVATWGKRRETDRRLDRISEKMSARGTVA
jgi:type I restriction enzyme S subunit